MKFRLYKVSIIVLYLTGVVMFAPAQDINIKKRLAGEANEYQPAILPTLSLDGSLLYFDRKRHPLNAGGTMDDDDIWMARLNPITREYGWVENVRKLNIAYSNAIFTLLPDGFRALAYYESRDTTLPGFGILNLRTGKFSPFVIIDFYNNLKTFYAYLSHDEEYLLLSLGRSDSKGGMDLYVSFRQEEGIYSKPMNIEALNTPLTETSPHLAFDNKTLYFSGETKKGKLEIYMVKRLDETWQNWSKPFNPGGYINAADYDDSGISLNAQGDSAITVSYDTATGKQGFYSVALPENMRPGSYYVQMGKIVSKEKALSGKITISSKGKGERIIEFMDGSYGFALSEAGDYDMVYEVQGYKSYKEKANISFGNKPIIKTADIEMEALGEEVKTKAERLRIYFETGSSELTADDEVKIKGFISGKSIKKFTLTGRADSRGREDMNYELSLRRAEAVKKFLLLNRADDLNINIRALGEDSVISGGLEENRSVDINIE